MLSVVERKNGAHRTAFEFVEKFTELQMSHSDIVTLSILYYQWRETSTYRR